MPYTNGLPQATADQIEVEKGKAQVVRKETRRAIRDLLKAKGYVPTTDSDTREDLDEQIQVERDAWINKLAEFKEAWDKAHGETDDMNEHYEKAKRVAREEEVELEESDEE